MTPEPSSLGFKEEAASEGASRKLRPAIPVSRFGLSTKYNDKKVGGSWRGQHGAMSGGFACE